MSVKQYFEFNGVKYGVGTIVKVPSVVGVRLLHNESPMVAAEFVGGACFVFCNQNNYIHLYESSDYFSGEGKQSIEIIKPVYYQEPSAQNNTNIFIKTKSGSWDAHNDVCVGLVWYIAIMLLALIFKARLAIWLLTTIIYFSWKANK